MLPLESFLPLPEFQAVRLSGCAPISLGFPPFFLPFWRLFLFLLNVCTNVCHYMHAVSLEARRGHQSPWNWKYWCLRVPHRCWELNRGSLEHQPVLLSSKPHSSWGFSHFYQEDEPVKGWCVLVKLLSSYPPTIYLRNNSRYRHMIWAKGLLWEWVLLSQLEVVLKALRRTFEYKL